MEGVYFIPFPKPITHPEKWRWVQLCGRPHKDFNVEKVSKYTYICSKHFVGGAGPTDPIPAIQIGSSPYHLFTLCMCVIHILTYLVYVIHN